MLVGMSQERLAECLGLTFQQVQKCEKGVNRIGAGRLFGIAGILGVPVTFFYDDLATRDDEAASGENAPSPAMEFVFSGEGVELSRAFLKITDAKIRRNIIDLVQLLAGDATPYENPHDEGQAQHQKACRH